MVKVRQVKIEKLKLQYYVKWAKINKNWTNIRALRQNNVKQDTSLFKIDYVFTTKSNVYNTLLKPLDINIKEQYCRVNEVCFLYVKS